VVNFVWDVGCVLALIIVANAVYSWKLG